MNFMVAIFLGWAAGTVAIPWVSRWLSRREGRRLTELMAQRREADRRLEREREDAHMMSLGAVGFDTKAKVYLMRDGSTRKPYPGTWHLYD